MEDMTGKESEYDSDEDLDEDSDEDSDDEFVVEWTETRRHQATGLPWGLPQWLLTNKAMLIDGLNTLEVSIFELPGETYTEVKEIKGNVYDCDLFSNLVAPFRARRIHLLIDQEVHNTYWMVTETLEMGKKEIAFCEGLFEDILYHESTKELQF